MYQLREKKYICFGSRLLRNPTLQPGLKILFKIYQIRIHPKKDLNPRPHETINIQDWPEIRIHKWGYDTAQTYLWRRLGTNVAWIYNENNWQVAMVRCKLEFSPLRKDVKRRIFCILVMCCHLYLLSDPNPFFYCQFWILICNPGFCSVSDIELWKISVSDIPTTQVQTK